MCVCIYVCIHILCVYSTYICYVYRYIIMLYYWLVLGFTKTLDFPTRYRDSVILLAEVYLILYPLGQASARGSQRKD